jgi:hypothetical protein
MKLHSGLRILSIICYSFIFVQGMMIAIPFILVLTIGIPDAPPTTRLFLLLADLGLIFLAILRFKKKNKLTIVLDCVIYFMLLSPFIWTLTKFPLKELNLRLTTRWASSKGKPGWKYRIATIPGVFVYTSYILGG